MLLNYIKIAFRNLNNKRLFSSINIVGLAMGMAACLSIYYYVNYEFSYNEFFKDSDQIYRSYFKRQTAEKTITYMYLGTAAKPKLDEITTIENSFRMIQIDYQNNSLVHEKAGAKNIVKQFGVQYADPEIKDVLSLEMVAGSFKKMDEPMKMVITESVARKFFEPSNAIGQTLTVSGNTGDNPYEVVGVIADIPSNTEFDLSVLLSIESIKQIENTGNDLNNWNSWNAETYVKSEASVNSLLGEFKRTITSLEFFTESDSKWEMNLMPIEDLHLISVDNDGQLNESAEKLLIGLSVIGLFILCIAWINFINLSTARALERAREVGVRKALGSNISNIRLQFMIEAFVINLIAAIFALTIVQAALPLIFQTDGRELISHANQLLFWLSIFGIILIGSFLSGLYPAFVLSRFKSVEVLKGKMTSQRGGALLRKGLVVFQFAASAIMITGTFIVYNQLTYLQNKDLGLKIDNIMVVDSPPSDVTSDNSFYKTVNAFKEELVQLNAVQNITASSDVPGRDTGWGTSVYRPGEGEGEKKRITLLTCDTDFDTTYGLQLLAGRFYQRGDGTFDKGTFVINEEAVQHLGFESAQDAIGEQLIEGRMFPDLTIVGVVKNFHQESLKSKIEPMAFVLSSWSNYYSIALNVNEDLSADEKAEQLRKDIAEVEAVWKKFFPENPFDYSFLDQNFTAAYQSDREFGFIVSLFAVLSIIIASLGLLGLASYSVIQRTKEIGIRKVLGASVSKIFGLLSLEYIWLISIAAVIAIPATYYGIQKWLSNYPYHIELSVWMFIIPMLAVFFIALLTIGSQVLKATLKNPVDSLRYE